MSSTTALTGAAVSSTLWPFQNYSYYATNQKVLEAKRAISDLSNFQLAVEKIKEVYTDGEKLLHQQLTSTSPNMNGEGIPFLVAENLLEILKMEQIQYEDQLKYELAKTTRLFLDLTLLTGCGKGRNVYDATYNGIITAIRNLKKTMPPTEVATMYEIDCCFASSLALQTADEYLKKFASRNLGDVIAAIVTMAPEKLLPTLKEAYKDFSDLLKTKWFVRVLMLNLSTKKDTLTKVNLSQSITNFRKENTVLYADVQNDRHVAFCFLESHVKFMNIAIEAGDNDVQKTLLEGTTDCPGIQAFVNIHLPDETASKIVKVAKTVYDELTDWWCVRYRTIDYLFRLFQYTNDQMSQETWKKCAEYLADKISKNDNKHVNELLSLHVNKCMQKATETNFSARIAYLKGKMPDNIKQASEKLTPVMQTLAEFEKQKKEKEAELAQQRTVLLYQGGKEPDDVSIESDFAQAYPFTSTSGTGSGGAQFLSVGTGTPADLVKATQIAITVIKRDINQLESQILTQNEELATLRMQDTVAKLMTL